MLHFQPKIKYIYTLHALSTASNSFRHFFELFFPPFYR